MATTPSGSGTKADPWLLTTPPGSSEFEAYRGETSDPPALVVQVKTTQLRYHLRCIDDRHTMLKQRGDWIPLGNADEQKARSRRVGRGVGARGDESRRRVLWPEEGPARALRQLRAVGARGTRPG